MDASTRWETEAIRTSNRPRTEPPRPSAKRTKPGKGNWVTLKEAEAATGIPSNTLRKWVRKDTIATYLESDGELALRMVDLDSVLDRAAELGRETTDSRQQTTEEISDPGSRIPDPDGADTILDTGSEASDSRVEDDVIADRGSEIEDQPQSGSDADTPIRRSVDAPADTLLVPVDAWNKMLSQLGNLHEAGQQLAEAMERAAKAETEAQFLRERLREMRETTEATTDNRQPTIEVIEDPGSRISDQSNDGDETSEVDSQTSESAPETTSYWRYLTTGWRNRNKK